MNNIKNELNIMQDFFINATKVDNTIVSKCSDKTQKFIEKLSNSTTEIIKTFLNNNATEVPLRSKHSKLYHYDNLLLTITDGRSAYYLEQNLQSIQGQSVTPKFIKFFELGNGEFLSVLEGDSEKLLPYSSMISSLSYQGKQLFKSTLKQIVNTTGQINKEIFANRQPLFVGKSSKNIIYGDWENLSIVDPSMKQYYLNQIDKISI